MYFRFIFILFFLGNLSFPLEIDVKADSAILINAETGKILFEKNSKKLQFPASTTKMATLLYVLEEKGGSFDLDEMIRVTREPLTAVSPLQKKRSNYEPAHWLVTDSSHMGLKVGEKIPFNSLLYGMALSSANDASNVVAEHVSGSIKSFVSELNEYLRRVGCTDTRFYNPHGLHHPKHVTTAHDLSLIAKRGLKNGLFVEIVSTERYKRPETNVQKATWMVTTNKLIRKDKKEYYPYALGIKTGATSKALYNLVTAAEKDGRKLIAVVMRCSESEGRFSDARNMFEAAFNEEMVSRKILTAGVWQKNFKINGKKSLKIALKDDVAIDHYPSERLKLKGKIKLDNVKFPILKGQRLGNIQIIDKDTSVMIKSCPIFAASKVSGSLFNKYYLLIIPFLAVLFLLRYRNKR